MSCPKPADSVEETFTVILQAETEAEKKQRQHVWIWGIFFPKDA